MEGISLPKFSGKSDAYLWFIVHATQFLKNGGRLSFVFSSAILFSDYGVVLVRFIGHHFKIRAVIESMVERWFPDADTNTVLLLLEREVNADARADNLARFIRLRRPLSQLIPHPDSAERRGQIEELIELMLVSEATEDDPRMQVNVVTQGPDGGLELDVEGNDDGDTDEESEE